MENVTATTTATKKKIYRLFQPKNGAAIGYYTEIEPVRQRYSAERHIN